jgi:hypothetical protein
LDRIFKIAREGIQSTPPGSLDTLKVSVPFAVKLPAAIRARPALDPDILAAEIVEDLEPALSQFAEIANDLRRN